MTETLDAPAHNAQIEGSAAAFGTLTPRVRLGNYCQIARKTGSVSETQNAVNKAGVANEYAHQLKKATTELARDIERAHWNGTKAVGASASSGRASGGVNYWCSTNRQAMSTATQTGTAGTVTSATVFVLTGGTPAAGDHVLFTTGTAQGQVGVVASVATTTTVTLTAALDVAPTAGDTWILYDAPAALTETVLNDGIQAAKDAGGNPNAIYVSGKQKRAISGFGTAIRRLSADGKKLGNAIDIYESDFGTMSVKYDRWTPVGTAAILEEGKFNTAFLRPINATKLAKVGSSEDFMIEGEFTLEALSENANSVIYGAAI